MVKRTLVTTALEETWPDNPKEPVLFLGEWCRLYSRREKWSKMNAEVVPYHWDDRSKIYRDYQYLNKIYESLLSELTTILNLNHKKNFSKKFWRIVLGPWLGYFTQVVFDRWTMIQRAVKSYSICHVRCLDQEKILKAWDMNHFQELVVSDQWNEIIFSNILKNEKKIRIEVVKPKKTKVFFTKPKIFQSLFASFFKIAKSASNLVSNSLCRPREQFMLGTYLSLKNEILLNLRLSQIPRKWFNKKFSSQKQCLPNKKNSIDLKVLNCNFGATLQKLVSEHIPFVFLENFQEALEVALKTPWPAAPGSILTSNLHYSNALFSIWAAAKTENKVPFFIAQHGGSFGVAKWNFLEDHDCNVAEKYFSFGWSKSKSKKIIPIGNLIESGRMIKRQSPSMALMVTMSMPRYSYWMYSAPVAAEQWQSYFLDLISFAKACSEDIKKSLLVRLYSQDYANNQKERWAASFPEIRLDSGNQPIRKLLKNTRIYISTYNATTYLESLYHNIPTLIFWNPNHWEIRDEAVPYFDLLEKVGIFHKSPYSAATHLNGIWEHIEEWWQRHEIQEARAKFCDRFSRVNADTIGSIANVLLDAGKKISRKK